jgi:hypothetical protein
LTTGTWIHRPRFGVGPEALGEPLPGDVVAWHRAPGSDWTALWRDWRGHVELVTDYDMGTDTLTTIAGNVGRYPARVQRRQHANGSWRHKLYGVARLQGLHPRAF